MKLVALGTGPFAVPSLRAVAASGRHEVLAVVTRPPRGRRREPPAPMAAAAEDLGLPLWQPDSVNLPESTERLRGYGADLLVVCDYGEILKPAALETTRYGGINLHGSLLPKYRGAAPVQWAVLNGDETTGATIIQMTPGLDAGPTVVSVETRIDPDETAGELEARLSELGATITLHAIDDIEAGVTDPEPQDKSLATKAPRLKKEDGLIDWRRSADELKNHVRGMNPWPRAYTHLPQVGGEPLRLVVDRVALAEGSGEPGEVLESDKRLVVAAGSGALELLEVQPAGKRRMPAADWLRGATLEAGVGLR